MTAADELGIIPRPVVEAEVINAWSWRVTPRTKRISGGLINETFALMGAEGEPLGVLQCLNTRIFRPEVHLDIEAVTRHVAAKGLATPVLQRTKVGRLWYEATDHTVWRVLSWVGDRTIERPWSGGNAGAAGALVARFHSATQDLDWQFRFVRGGFHDTPRRMQQLEEARERHPHHRLRDEVARVADSIAQTWTSWDGAATLPRRVVHGDLKTSNVRFRGDAAVALIDLDTLAHGTLDAELGDAFRSWCNPALEDEPARFDADLFADAIRGYVGEARSVTAQEWDSIVPGIERITLELAARFAADALDESYFGYDRTRFATAGDHHLARARAQLELALQIRAARGAAEEVVRAAVQSGKVAHPRCGA